MRGFGIVTVGQMPGWMEKPRPTPGPQDAIITPVVISPCTSDTHIALDPIRPAGLIIGHECVGRVDEVGAEVTLFKKGDLVAVACATPDWSLRDIQDTPFSLVGTNRLGIAIDGAYAEYLRVPQADMNLAMVPDGLSLESVLMSIDVMNTGYTGAEIANIKVGDTVVVIGIGPIGLMAVAAASMMGAGRIIAIGNRPVTMELARHYGANEVISYKDGDIVAQIKERVPARGADVVIVAGGDAESVLDQAMWMVRTGGTVSNIAVMRGDINISEFAFNRGNGNKTLTSALCVGGGRRIERMLALIQAGRVDPAPLVSHKLQGLDACEPAWHLMRDKPVDLVKPVVYF